MAGRSGRARDRAARPRGSRRRSVSSRTCTPPQTPLGDPDVRGVSKGMSAKSRAACFGLVPFLRLCYFPPSQRIDEIVVGDRRPAGRAGSMASSLRASVSSPLASAAAWMWAALVAAMVLTSPRSAHAQALEPRSYTNTQVGINFLLLGYGHTEGDVGLDASTPVKDVRVRIDAGFLAYARSLDIWGLSGKVLAVLPVAEASGSAKVKGQGRDRNVFGLGDPLLRVSVNFFGAPALSLNEF